MGDPAFRRAAVLLLPVDNPEGHRAGLGPAHRIETEVPNWAAELLFWSRG